jgi:LPS sulfotransferase NodH/predicted SAM-dependent methyltransferase/carbonic anhydrase/acetyltransferase-like protein (isoleucine patch superfamily)
LFIVVYQEKEMKTLLIAFTMRCGSNFLCEHLRANGIGDPAEYFQYPFGVANRQFYDDLGVDYGDFTGFLDALIENKSVNDIFSVKIAWDHKNAFLDAIKKIDSSIDSLEDFFPGARWLFLRRHDKVAQAISLWKAQKTGVWVAKNSSMPVKEKPEYKFFEILDSLMHILVEDLFWERYFYERKIDPLTLYYEDYEQNVKNAVLMVARYLGVSEQLRLSEPNDIASVDAIVKQRDSYSEEIYRRFKSDILQIGVEDYWSERSADISRWKGFRESQTSIVVKSNVVDVDDLRSRGAKIGRDVFFGPDVYVERDFASLLTIEDGVVLSRGVSIFLHDSSLNNVIGAPIKFGPVRLRRNCYIGANSTILCGVEVGENAIVGASSLVTCDIPANTYAYGQPARVRGNIQDLMMKHRESSDGRFLYLSLPPWRERKDKKHDDDYMREFLVKESASLREEGRKVSANQSFFSSDLDSKEIEDILKRIDDHIARRLDVAEVEPAKVLAELPDTSALDHHLYEVRRSTAPLFAVTGRHPKQILRRTLNLPIRVFGHKQRHFNRELVALVEQMVAQIYSLRQVAASVLSLYETVRRLSVESQTSANQIGELRQSLSLVTAEQRGQREWLEQVATEQRGQREWLEQVATEQRGQREGLEQVATEQRGQREWLEQVATEQRGQREWLEQVATEQRGQREWLEQVATEQRGQREWLEQVATEQRGQREWLEQVATEQRGQREWLEQVAMEQRGYGDWIKLLERKQQILALDVREMIPSIHHSDFPEPRIVDQERYSALLESMNGAVKINVGCGEKPLPDYINIDIRDVPGVDVVADARRLPFDDGSLAEVASFHLVEHFRKHHLKTVVLPYWRRLLARDGCLRIVCPNWEAMLERLNDGRMSLAEFSLVTFGAQDYEGDDHFAMYTPDTLTEVLQQAGFSRVEVIEHERMNGICPEMEIIAYV